MISKRLRLGDTVPGCGFVSRYTSTIEILGGEGCGAQSQRPHTNILIHVHYPIITIQRSMIYIPKSNPRSNYDLPR